MRADFDYSRPYPLGAHREVGGIRVAFVSQSEDCGVIFYDRDTGRETGRYPFSAGSRVGHVYYQYIPGLEADKVCYQFYEGERLLPDPWGRVFLEHAPYGRARRREAMLAGFLTEDFDWGKDHCPRIPYEDCICYQLHVRGFTRHTSSGVPHRGTFLGVAEKVPYLKELGVTTVELQPAYEFIEKEELSTGEEEKLNYWGYQRGFYYAPKCSYSEGEPVSEFRRMVKELHENGIEVIMQFYFPKEVSGREIPEILAHWVAEYHVDGFHLMGEGIPADLIAAEPALADVKLWYYDFNTEEINARKGIAVESDFPEQIPGKGRGRMFAENAATTVPGKRSTLASYREDYMWDMRRFLKGDGDMLEWVMRQMRENPRDKGRIHYFADYSGFTIMDLVSYDRKHNEENGENNLDGSEENASWNCGVEGQSRKKQVTSLRIRQYKNALAMLFLTQSTPLLFMGDEFGNSQRGNNNPYCQDSEVTWLNWRDIDRNREIYEFALDMIHLRKAHPVLHQGKRLLVMDTLSCGYPDLSYHGEEAWRPSLQSYDRQVGMMYCGKYARKEDGGEDDFFYVALNMHWESKSFALPRLPKELEWDLLFMTEDHPEEALRETPGIAGQEQSAGKNTCKLPPRTVAVFISREA